MTVFCPISMNNVDGPFECVEFTGDTCHFCPPQAVDGLRRAIDALTYTINADGQSPADVIAYAVGDVAEAIEGLGQVDARPKQSDAEPEREDRRRRRRRGRR